MYRRTYKNGELFRVRKYNKHNELISDLHYKNGLLHGNCDIYTVDDNGFVTLSGYTCHFVKGMLRCRIDYIYNILARKSYYDRDENVTHVIRYYHRATLDETWWIYSSQTETFWDEFYKATGIEQK